jgi:hypothetical protein
MDGSNGSIWQWPQNECKDYLVSGKDDETTTITNNMTPITIWDTLIERFATIVYTLSID